MLLLRFFEGIGVVGTFVYLKVLYVLDMGCGSSISM